jgi:hypothetical protein
MRFLVIATLLACAAPAAAYPWTITHSYASCAACHVDPSGGTELTAYGRGMSDVIVRWHVDPQQAQKDQDANGPSSTSQFMFAVPLPEWLGISGNLREGVMALPNTNGTVSIIPLLMANDLSGTLELGPVVAHASAGYGFGEFTPGRTAVVWQPNPKDPLQENAIVSREHWLGLKLFDGSLEIRAGRINLPFGLRNVEHTSFVRDKTRTNIDVDQSHGVAVWYANDFLRGEIMGIAGNYQVRPDEVRERGYSGYVEVTPVEHLGLGASSLITYAKQDVVLGVPNLRQAHGVFARWGPTEQIALMFEGDALINTHKPLTGGNGQETDIGGAGWLALDYAPVQGIHFQQAFETYYAGDKSQALPTLGAWLSAMWYVLPHVELRTDGIYQEVYPPTGGSAGSFTGLLQIHMFL